MQRIMHKRLTSPEADDQAAQWATLIDARTLSEQEQVELDVWLESDPRHLGAFAKASAVIASSHRLRRQL